MAYEQIWDKITQAEREQLKEMGYSRARIEKMTLVEAYEIFGKPLPIKETQGVLPLGGNEFWSKAARDMTQVLITFGGYDRKELIDRLIAKVTTRNRRVQERHVLEVADEMRKEAQNE